MEFLGGQQGKDLALSLLWLWLPLWCVFDPWPRNFRISLARPKKEREALILEELGVPAVVQWVKDPELSLQ